MNSNKNNCNDKSNDKTIDKDNNFYEEEDLEYLKNNNPEQYINTLKKYFPNEENINYKNLELNKIGLYSISKPNDAQVITNYLTQVLISFNLDNIQSFTITDATAGFGGNTINFSHRFGKVISIEKNNENFSILKNNCSVYGLKNIEFIQGSFLKYIPEKCGDILFMDPPWGGKKYRLKDNIMLYLDKNPIYDIINQIPNKTKIIAIKIPYNFDYGNFIKKLYPNQAVINKKIKNYNLLIIHRLET